MLLLGSNLSADEFRNALLNAPDGETIKLSSGTYFLNQGIDRTLEKGLSIIGEAGTIIDGRNCTDTNLIRLGGQRLEVVNPDTDSVKGSMSLYFTANTKLGDMWLIRCDELWNSSRAYYRKGEIVEVEEKNGAEIRLKTPLCDNYSKSTTTFVKLQMPTIAIRDVKVLRNSNHTGIRVDYARDVELTNVVVSGARQSGITIYYVNGGVISNATIEDSYYVGSGESYGLTVASSQKINILGGRYTGGRHGITHGGNEPCRYIVIDGAMVSNYLNSGQGALDTHGNTEYVKIVNCVVFGGVAISSINTDILNNTIISPIERGVPGVYWYGEVGKDGYLNIKGNSIQSNNGFGIYLNAVASGISLKNVNIENNVIESLRSCVRVSGSVTSFTMDTLTINNNNMTSDSEYCVCVLKSGSQRIPISELIIQNSKVKSTSYRALYLCLEVNSDVIINNSTFVSSKSNDWASIIANCRNLNIMNSKFVGVGTRYNIFQCSKKLQITSCIFEGFTMNGGIRYSKGDLADEQVEPSVAIIRDNYNINTSGTMLKGTVPTYSYINALGSCTL